MFVNRLLNRGPTPLIEQMVKFTEKRARLLGQDITNLSTPNYVNQDLSLDRFQQLLAQQAEERDRPVQNGELANNEQPMADISTKIESPSNNILFHDRNNRSVEQLMSDQAQNAMLHNMMIELLRRQFSQLQEALREKVS